MAGTEVSGDYFIYDPNPVDRDDPVLIGPFKRKDEAEQYANVIHPDDGSGNAVVLRAEAS